MWYTTAKKIMQRREAGYSQELGDLRDTLKGGINPYDYQHRYQEYLGDSDPTLAEEMEDSDDAYDHFYSLDVAGMERFKSWLEDRNDLAEGGYYDPIYHSMGWSGFSRPAWNVHFTDNADDIEKRGFEYGHPDMEGLALTTYKKNRQKESGYNFSFPAHARDAKNAERESKYGRDAVLFYGGGADVNHFGDEERQRLFWGKNVDPRMIFPIQRDSNGDWYVQDATGRTLIEGKDYGEIAEWVQKNYRMLQSIREKQKRRALQRSSRFSSTATRSAQYEDANLGAMQVSQKDMGHVMNRFIKHDQGEPQFIESNGQTQLLIHGSAPQNGVVWFYIGANQQFGNNPVGYVPQDQLDEWITQQGHQPGIPVIGCYSGQAEGVNSAFGNQGEITLQVPEDGSGDQLYFGD